jgi:hypothetical protein
VAVGLLIDSVVRYASHVKEPGETVIPMVNWARNDGFSDSVQRLRHVFQAQAGLACDQTNPMANGSIFRSEYNFCSGVSWDL